MSDAARSVLKKRSKSFHWAGRLLSGPQLQNAAGLYAFCRYLDDLADDLPPDESQRLLTEALNHIAAGKSDIPEISAFLKLAEDKDINPAVPLKLVETLLLDSPPVRITGWDQLIRYSYGVASTVGLMMCDVFDVKDSAAHPFAIDLGIAMQLTNIARDVLEDAENDRVYLPAGADFDPRSIVDGDSQARDHALELMRETALTADVYYRSADQGMRWLPFRARLAILTASRLYEEIGLQAVMRSDYWAGKTIVSDARKTMLTMESIAAFHFNPLYRPSSPAPTHNPDLHAAIRGLPGADDRVA